MPSDFADDGTIRQAVTAEERASLQRELYGLYQEQGEVDSEIARLQEERNAIRGRMSLLVYRLGEKAELPGVARFRLSGAATGYRYDRKAIDRLVTRMEADGLDFYARAFREARKDTSKAGGLVVSPIREKVTEESDDDDSDAG